MKRNGWTRLSDPKRDSKASHWRHDPSGWALRHCGHATAIWPFYAVDPAHPSASTMTHNGLGFRTLEDGMQAIEDVLAGVLVATDDRCGPSTRRILPPAQLEAEQAAPPPPATRRRRPA